MEKPFDEIGPEDYKKESSWDDPKAIVDAFNRMRRSIREGRGMGTIGDIIDNKNAAKG
jgi:hypothetical protein